MSRNFFLLVFLILLLICSSNNIFAAGKNSVIEEEHLIPYEQLTLIWSDEFNYTGFPDPDKWSYDVGGHGWGNGEKQYYTEKRKENVWVENGRLTITVRKEEYQGNEYTSSRLVTKNKGDWLYGRVEVRAKLPRGRGTWPAIWMLPTDWTYGAWPNSGEIDIMEHVGYDMDMVHGSVHTSSYNHKLGTHKTKSIRVDKVDSKFHVYALEWYPDKILIFVDDIHYFTFKNEHTGWREWPFDQPFHLILNIAVGGGWGGLRGLDDSIWPQKMEVDYVRVYNLNISERDKTPPVQPAEIKVEPFSIYVNLSWDQFVDDFGVKEYQIYLNETLVGKTKTRNFQVGELKPDTEYEFKVRAMDYGGNTSEYVSVKARSKPLPIKEVPGRVEAEDYLEIEEGIATEMAYDHGGGVNLCYIGDNDWMKYVIDVQKSGRYKASFRLAGVIEGELEIRDEKGRILTAVDVPPTGGWQEWTTVTSKEFSLPEGEQVIELYAKVGGFNFNWFEIKPAN